MEIKCTCPYCSKAFVIDMDDALKSQDFCFTRSHLRWPSKPETMLRLFTNSTEPGVTGGLPPSGHQTDAWLCQCSALQCACNPGGAPAAGKTCPNSTHSLNRGMWDLPRLGNQTHTTALAGGFFTPEPPGKPTILYSYILVSIDLMLSMCLWNVWNN